MGFGVVIVLFACSFEEGNAGRIEGRRRPFPLRFEKECKGVATNVYTVVDGVLDACMTCGNEVSMGVDEDSWRSMGLFGNTPFAALTCAPIKCVFVTALAAIGTMAAASSASFWAFVRRGFFSVLVADVVFDAVVAVARFSATTDVVVVSAIATVVVRLRFRLETSATATEADSSDWVLNSDTADGDASSEAAGESGADDNGEELADEAAMAGNLRVEVDERRRAAT